MTQPPAIELENLSWTYEGSPHAAISDINVSIAPGELVGIVGPNEHGKSTLLNCVNGLIPHARTGSYVGSVRLFGKSVAGLSGPELARVVGTVFSDPESQFTAMTVEDELAFGLENIGCDPEVMATRIAEVSRRLGIDDLLEKSTFEVSGGQKQRIALASVLVMLPPIMLFDEPTSMLDPLSRKEMFQVLSDLKRNRTHTIVVVEHNLEYLAPIADRLLLISGGRIVKDGEPRAVFEDAADQEYLQLVLPEATQFAKWLQSWSREESGDVLPIDSDEGLAFAEATLNRIRARAPSH